MLKINSLSVAYGKYLAVDGVSLSISPGEIVGLIGPNGAGKSSLIRAVSGVLPARSGEVTFEQRDVLLMSPVERARYVSVVSQARQMGGAFTVMQAVLMGRTAYMNWLGKPGKKDVAQAWYAMELTKLEDLADRKIAELSGGEQQRVMLARALAQDAPALLLDEPTNHLDLQHQINFLELVVRLANDANKLILIALHDLNLVGRIADRVTLLVSGRLTAKGTPEEVLTPEILEIAYNSKVRVITDPLSETPIILPWG